MNFLKPVNAKPNDPIQAVLERPDDAVLAVIAGVEGPSYRPLGAMMGVFPDKERVGTLSSGCIEGDISVQAELVRETCRPRLVRYGRGSPYIDIELPCGGGLDILLLPEPHVQTLGEVAANQAARRRCSLEIDLDSGAMKIVDAIPTARNGAKLTICFEPDIRFLVFGKGPEASTFAALVQSGGYSSTLLSPDAETLEAGRNAGSETVHLVSQAFPGDLEVDDRTAIVLFFHDHDWEPPILAGALETPAFYIGAQGSKRARDSRMRELEAMDVSPEALARLHGPIGLIPSARDAGTLAVSVLAEILAVAMKTPA